MAAAERKDPYLGSRFHVEIDGLIVAGFSDVSGLQMETDVEDYREGGVNDYIHKFPKESKQTNLVLKRGITESDALWQWHRDVVDGNFQRKSGRIILFDFLGNEKWHWTFEEAFPVKWIGPDLKADSGNTAIETLELVHEGLKKG